MSSYGYGPPPPPPPASGGAPSYGQAGAAYPQHGQPRGGSHGGRGRGGPYSNNQGGYQGGQPPRYDYGSQPYVPQYPPAYGSAPQPAYPNQAQSAAHGHHAPAPISAANYHPNYANQAYAAPQYSQQPGYAPPQPYTPASYAPPPPDSSKWNGQGPPQGSAYGGGRPHRSGYGGGGSQPRGRPGVDQGSPPVAHGSYVQPYAHDPRAAAYSHQPYPYSLPPQPAAPRQGGFQGHGQHRRGRGGHRDGGRGRGGNHNDRGRPNKPHVQTAPSKKPEAAPAGKKKKRKTNTLGLTPGMDSESEDDEGEEKVLTDLIGSDTLSVSDVAAFLAERRKNFPTRARVEAKKKAAAELAQSGQDKAAELEKQADKLRKQLAKVESSIKRKREQGDEGDEMRESSDGSSDEQPEEVSARVKPASSPPPPAKKADISKHCKYYATGGLCGKQGKCRFVHDPEVREAALKEREANQGRMTIQQRLLLNDKDQEDLTILKSIQYLRQKGLVSQVAESKKGASKQGIKQEKHHEQGNNGKHEKPQKHGKWDKNRRKKSVSGSSSGFSLLPTAPASLPPNPIKKEAEKRTAPPIAPQADGADGSGTKNQDWLLQPYRGSNGKPQEVDDLP